MSRCTKCKASFIDYHLNKSSICSESVCSSKSTKHNEVSGNLQLPFHQELTQIHVRYFTYNVSTRGTLSQPQSHAVNGKTKRQPAKTQHPYSHQITFHTPTKSILAFFLKIKSDRLLKKQILSGWPLL